MDYEPTGTPFSYGPILYTLAPSTPQYIPPSLSGEYGNWGTVEADPWVLFVGNQNYDSVEKIIDLSDSDYLGQSVVGLTGHVFFRYQTGSSWQQDPQLYKIDFGGRDDSNNLLDYVKVGQNSVNWGWGYAQWMTTYRTTNASYMHVISGTGAWANVAHGNSPTGKWHRYTGVPPSGIAVNLDYHIYFEGSYPAYGSPQKHVYLRSKEFTFTTNTIKIIIYGRGTAINKMFLGIYIVT
jgi:hypothetical protein